MNYRFRAGIAMSGALALALVCTLGASASLARTRLVSVRYVSSHRHVLLEDLPQFVAEDKGLFKKNGVDIHFLSGGGGGTTLRLLSTGNVQMAQGGLSAAILAAKSDPNVELVAGWCHSANVMVWIAPSRTNVHSVQDLRGRKLGYSHAGSASQRLAQMAIKAAGVKDVKLVSVGGMGANWAAAKGGVITAGWAMEPFQTEKIRHDGARIVLNPGEYVKHFYLEGIDVNKEFATKHPAAVRGVLNALAEAIDFIKNHPEEAAGIAARHLKEKASVSVLKSGIEHYLKEDIWDLKTDPKAYDTVINSMVANGEIDHPIDIGKLLNQRYLPAKSRVHIR